MKAATAIGIGLAFGSLLLSSMMDGTSPASFINIPALMIILGGTGGVTLASVGMDSMKRVPSLYKLVFSAEPPDMRGQLDRLVALADKARREGLLALDAQLGEIEDTFTRNALQLVVDGTDPEMVHAILEAEVDGMAARHEAGAAPFEKAGGFAPTMGIIGTVLGLVHVLQNLAAPSTLGPSISAAFIATLMGVGAANVIFLPIANRLKAISGEEVELRMMTLEGILSIQAGDNPRLVSEKLMSYVPPAERADEEEPPSAQRRPSNPRRPEHGSRARRGAPAMVARTRRATSAGCLTYADMITLLMALFMVLFSISSVNISKYQTLQKSLKAAFSGNILPGGKAIAQAGRDPERQPRARDASNCRRSCRSRREQRVETLQSSTAHGAAPQRGPAAGRGPARGGDASRTSSTQLDAYARQARLQRESQDRDRTRRAW